MEIHFFVISNVLPKANAKTEKDLFSNFYVVNCLKLYNRKNR